MTNLRICAVIAATLIVVAAKSISVAAQTSAGAKPAEKTKTATISLSIGVPIKQVAMGQKPWVALDVENLSTEEIAYPRDRVYVEGPNGEPPTTLVQR